jgi:hypothetical protein
VGNKVGAGLVHFFGWCTCSGPRVLANQPSLMPLKIFFVYPKRKRACTPARRKPLGIRAEMCPFCRSCNAWASYHSIQIILDYVSHTNQKQRSPYQETERSGPYRGCWPTTAVLAEAVVPSTVHDETSHMGVTLAAQAIFDSQGPCIYSRPLQICCKVSLGFLCQSSNKFEYTTKVSYGL